jgi:foldase protein PrsA
VRDGIRDKAARLVTGVTVAKFNAQRSQRHPASMVIAGTLIAAVAVGVGVQLLRAGPEATKKEKRSEVASTSNSALSLPAVRINGEVVTREQLALECMEQFGHQVLDSLISRKIIQQACAVNRISKHAGLPTDQWHKFIQSERGLTERQYHRDVIWPLLALKKIAGREVRITNEMLKEAYIDNYGPRVKARMILFDNLHRAQKVVALISEYPENFADYAREHSVEPNSKSLGGKIPPIRRYSGAHEEIREAAFSMKNAGDVSPLLQIAVNRYAILQYEGRTEPVEHRKEDVKEILHDDLVDREVQSLVAETFEGLRKNAKVDNYIKGEKTGPIQQVSARSDDKANFAGDEPSTN